LETQSECLLCFVRQALLTAKKVTDKDAEIYASIQAAIGFLPSLNPQLTPAEGASLVNHVVASSLGVPDPFQQEKVRYNELALKLYPHLTDYVVRSNDPLKAAVHVAALGNAIDLSVVENIDVDTMVAGLPETTLAIDHFYKFQEEVQSVGSILYLGDNAGEIVFDRVLVETLPLDRVIFAVKSGPVVNDVTMQDTRQSGMDQVARIIETGSNFAGVPLNRCSEEFLQVFHSVDLILSKGQANFETLDDVDANIFFLLKSKCNCIARYMGIKVGEMVFVNQHIRRYGQDRT